MDNSFLNLNIDIVWLQIVLLFLGITFIIIALFRPKENSLIDEKIEKIFEDFITQIDVENEEILKKISQSQNELPLQLNQKIDLLEKRIEKIEQADLKKVEEGARVPSAQFDEKYQEVLNLFESGESIDNISKKTKIGHAEVKLILELSKKGFKYV